MKTPNRHKYLLYIAIVITLVVGAVYVYMYREISLSRLQTEAVKQQLQANEQKLRNNEAFLKTYESTANDWKSLNDFFVKSDHFVDYIETLEALGPKTGSSVSISNIDDHKIDLSTPGKIGTMTARVNASGSWSSVMRVLALAENMPYKTSVKDVRLQMGDKSKKEWDLDFEINAFVLVSSTSTTAKK